MPPNATIDDAIERLVFLAKVEAGLAELDRSEGVPHDEARNRFGLLEEVSPAQDVTSAAKAEAETRPYRSGEPLRHPRSTARSDSFRKL